MAKKIQSSVADAVFNCMITGPRIEVLTGTIVEIGELGDVKFATRKKYSKTAELIRIIPADQILVMQGDIGGEGKVWMRSFGMIAEFQCNADISEALILTDTDGNPVRLHIDLAKIGYGVDIMAAVDESGTPSTRGRRKVKDADDDDAEYEDEEYEEDDEDAEEVEDDEEYEDDEEAEDDEEDEVEEEEEEEWDDEEEEEEAPAPRRRR